MRRRKLLKLRKPEDDDDNLQLNKGTEYYMCDDGIGSAVVNYKTNWEDLILSTFTHSHAAWETSKRS